MGAQEISVYVFERSPRARSMEEPKALVGMLHAVLFSLPLWGLIIWAVKALLR